MLYKQIIIFIRQISKDLYLPHYLVNATLLALVISVILFMIINRKTHS